MFIYIYDIDLFTPGLIKPLGVFKLIGLGLMQPAHVCILLSELKM